jgi:hypothetical protein
MDDNFFIYLQRLELIAFFSGYPILYAIAVTVAGEQNQFWKKKLKQALPYGYALTGVLFVGLQLKKLYPDYSMEHMNEVFQNPWLTVWGILSLLFWFPLFSKKTVLSFIHSLVFFFFVVRDIISNTFSAGQKETLKNDMSIYTNSFVLNCITFCAVFACAMLFHRFTRSKSL